MFFVLKLHFHADCDGITSAYFVSNELDRLKIKHSLHPSLSSEVEVKGKNNITLDLSSVKTDSIQNFSIDHHVSERLNLVYTNPRRSGFEWPVSFTTYALFGEIKDAWKSALAVVADWGAETVPRQFWETVKKRWPTLVPKIKQEVLVKSKLGEMALMIDCHVALYRSKGAMQALAALKEAKSPGSFLRGEGKARALKASKAKVLKEVKSIFGRDEVHKKFVLIRFQSKNRIKSLVAAFAKDKYPKKMIIIAQDEKDTIRLSFRHGDNLNVLVKTLTKDIGGGGGHPRASGGHVQKDQWDLFYSRLTKKFG